MQVKNQTNFYFLTVKEKEVKKKKKLLFTLQSPTCHQIPVLFGVENRRSAILQGNFPERREFFSENR